MKKMQYQVTLQEVDNGYVVRVGCKLLVFEDRQKLLNELTAHIKGEETELSKKFKQQEAIAQSEPQTSLSEQIAHG